MSATDNRVEALSEMKRSLWIGIICLVMVGVLMWLLSLEFARANDLLKNGTVGVATALSDSRSVTGRKGRISYVTEISISGAHTTVGLKVPLSAGQRVRIIYSSAALADWSTDRKGWFYSYMVGDSAMSASALVEEKLGDTYTLGRWVIAAFGLGGLYLIYDYFGTWLLRRPNKRTTDNSGAAPLRV